jgi:hypothetical protein
MCKNCFLEGINIFATWQEFESFDQVLESKRAAGQLVMVEKPLSTLSANDLMLVDAYYQCSSCNEIWVLSSPDNAWRGYFLPLEQAKAYVQRVKTSDRAKRIGCLVFIVVTLFSLLWKVIW